MDIKSERYEGAIEGIDGYESSAGAIYSFDSGSRTYKFQIEDGMRRYAISVGAVVDGRAVKVFLHEPYGSNDEVIGIPRSCPVFQEALRELENVGVEVLRFYDRASGGYASLLLKELQNLQ